MGYLSKKRIFIGFLLLCLVLGLFFLIRQLQIQQDPRSSAAGEAVNFTIAPSSLNIVTSGTGTFTLTLNAATNNTTGVDVTLTYDTALVQSVAWEPVTTGFSTVLNEGIINTTNGTIRFTAVNINAATMPSTITLGKVNLTMKPTLGSGTIRVTSAQVTAAGIDTALPLGVTSPATFTVVNPTPTPTNTPVPTNTPTPTLTPTPTPTPTNTPTPTPIPPTNTPTPTPVPPTVLVTINAPVIPVPNNTTIPLSWTTTNATSCTASVDWTGTKAVNGSETVGPFIGPKQATFTLTCTGPGGTRSYTASVQVSAPTPTPTPVPLVGDYNRDGSVNVLDFNLWRDEYLGVLTTMLSDQNKDGTIDLIDFNLWRNVFIATP